MTATSENLAQKIGRLGLLIEREAEAKPQRDEPAKLNNELQLHCTDHLADQAVRLQGNTYSLDRTAREKRREITDKPKAFAVLRAAVGMQKLVEASTITFKLLDSAVPAEKQAAKEQRDA